MQVKVTKLTGEAGLVECGEDGSLIISEGDITLDDMRESLRGVRPNSATGEVNTLDAEAPLVLRSLESAGWLVDWPEVAEGSYSEDDDEELDQDIIVN